MIILDLRKTSHLSDDTSASSEDIFSGGGDPVGSSTTEKWFKGEKGTSYKKLLLNADSKFAHYFDLDAVARFFDSHITGTRNLEKQLFTLISLYYWMEKNG